jgi:hypothetical protein
MVGDETTSADTRPMPVLFVHHRRELGGSPQSLYYLLRALDRTRFEPHVYCPPGPAARLFEDAGATVHTGGAAGFTHIWASTYSGRREHPPKVDDVTGKIGDLPPK